MRILNSFRRLPQLPRNNFKEIKKMYEKQQGKLTSKIIL